jgi:hypothetical protein
VLSLVRRYGGGLLVLDYDGAIRGFCRAVGADTRRTFTLKEIAGFAGLTLPAANHWVKVGVLRPSVSPCRGSGHVRAFSWQDGFWAGLAGSLSRQGVGLLMLRKLAEGFSAEQGADRPNPVAEEVLA